MGAGLRDIAPKEVYSVPITKEWSGDTNAYAVVDISALHPNESSKKIVVINFFYTNNSVNSMTFKSGTTALTGAMITQASGIVKGNYNPDGHFKTAAGEDLNIVPSANAVIGGWLNYYLE